MGFFARRRAKKEEIIEDDEDDFDDEDEDDFDDDYDEDYDDEDEDEEEEVRPAKKSRGLFGRRKKAKEEEEDDDYFDEDDEDDEDDFDDEYDEYDDDEDDFDDEYDDYDEDEDEEDEDEFDDDEDDGRSFGHHLLGALKIIAGLAALLVVAILVLNFLYAAGHGGFVSSLNEKFGHTEVFKVLFPCCNIELNLPADEPEATEMPVVTMQPTALPEEDAAPAIPNFGGSIEAQPTAAPVVEQPVIEAVPAATELAPVMTQAPVVTQAPAQGGTVG